MQRTHKHAPILIKDNNSGDLGIIDQWGVFRVLFYGKPLHSVVICNEHHVRKITRTLKSAPVMFRVVAVAKPFGPTATPLAYRVLCAGYALEASV